MYIGEIIKKYRTKYNLSQRAFAKKTSLSPSYINTLEKIYNPKTGKRYSVTTKVASEIAKAMSITLEDLLGDLNENSNSKYYDSKNNSLTSSVSSIPVIRTLKSNYDYLAKENIDGVIDIPQELANSGDFFALKIKDDSMAPAIIEGDYIIVKKQSNFENGDIVVSIIKEDEATIRRAKKSNIGLLLQPLNTNYEPLIFTNNELKSIPVTIFGVVKRLERNF